MFWLYPALASYFLFSITSIFNRFLLAGPLPNAGAYAFTIAAAGGTVVVLIPFGFSVPENSTIIVALLAGIISIAAFVSLYHVIRIGSISRVIPTVGAMVPLLILGFTALIVPQEVIVSRKALLAILWLVIGTILLTIRSETKRSVLDRTSQYGLAALTALLFASSTVMSKFVYEDIGFLNGLIWVNFGSFLMVPVLLLFSSVRTFTLSPQTWKQKRLLLPLTLEKGTGALGSLLQQYAIFLVPFGQLALMNALQGIQYLFILIFVGVIGIRHPKFLGEQLTRRTLPFRISGVVAIILGLYAMAT